MKIAVIHPFLSLRGGAERKIILITRELQKQTSTDLLVYKLNEKTSFTELLGTITHPIVIEAASKGAWILKTIQRCLKADYDIIVASNPPSNIVALFTKILRPKVKIAWICNEVAPTLHNEKVSLTKRFTWFIEKKLTTRFDLLIANSQFTAQSILSYFGIQATVIHSGVDVSSVPSQEPTDRLKHLMNENFNLTISRIEKHKNIDLISKIANADKYTKIVIAGTGVDQNYLREAIRDFSNVEYLGSISDSEKNWLLQHAKVFLFLPTHEPLGVTVMEALSFNTPVIAFNAGGPKEVVLNGVNGILCDTEQEYLNNISKASSLHPLPDNSGHQYIELKFSNERMVLDFKKAILSLKSV